MRGNYMLRGAKRSMIEVVASKEEQKGLVSCMRAMCPASLTYFIDVMMFCADCNL